MNLGPCCVHLFVSKSLGDNHLVFAFVSNYEKQRKVMWHISHNEV